MGENSSKAPKQPVVALGRDVRRHVVSPEFLVALEQAGARESFVRAVRESIQSTTESSSDGRAAHSGR